MVVESILHEKTKKNKNKKKEKKKKKKEKSPRSNVALPLKGFVNVLNC
jgi:hypothetical protein